MRMPLKARLALSVGIFLVTCGTIGAPAIYFRFDGHATQVAEAKAWNLIEGPDNTPADQAIIKANETQPVSGTTHWVSLPKAAANFGNNDVYNLCGLTVFIGLCMLVIAWGLHASTYQILRRLGFRLYELGWAGVILPVLAPLAVGLLGSDHSGVQSSYIGYLLTPLFYPALGVLALGVALRLAARYFQPAPPLVARVLTPVRVKEPVSVG